ncbi:hypothetical protein HYPSUDRAFT_201403 [Hypholoma sublateritium FD-334 SS-4]|uniref:Uncharacterized protein n=1 Tax=Hypholoma sublateritium (strain FD-334 SS-4) TaxID=945553 RepID=A0A0D2NX51_HYPSF|nr:hypothetical protein HYPSUDRAFT_201403 [Hypholoma sublateritium FD-334 SS-4]
MAPIALQMPTMPSTLLPLHARSTALPLKQAPFAATPTIPQFLPLTETHTPLAELHYNPSRVCAVRCAARSGKVPSSVRSMHVDSAQVLERSETARQAEPFKTCERAREFRGDSSFALSHRAHPRTSSRTAK